VVTLFFLFFVADFSGIGFGSRWGGFEFLLDFLKGVTGDFVVRLDFDGDWRFEGERLGFKFGVLSGD